MITRFRFDDMICSVWQQCTPASAAAGLRCQLSCLSSTIVCLCTPGRVVFYSPFMGFLFFFGSLLAGRQNKDRGFLGFFGEE